MKWIKYLLLPLFSLALFIGLCEMGGYVFFHGKPAIQLFEAERNYFIQNWDEQFSCSFPETIIAHPQLGFVHRKDKQALPDCKLPVNNIGLGTKRDLPIIKNKNEFRIMLIGGSVAHQLSNYETTNGKIYLEEYLNQHYQSPNGKPFIISTGAAGAWRMPNQIIMTMLYSNRVDGIIDIDGYNEGYPLMHGRMFNEIYGATTYIAGQSKSSFLNGYLSLLKKYRRIIKKTHFDHLYTSYIIYHNLTALVTNYFVSPSIIKEFSIGDNQFEKLKLDIRKEFARDQLKDFMIKLHENAKFSGIKSAQFLQPTRYYKTHLTEKEKNYYDELSIEVLNPIRNLYKELSKKYPIDDLSDIYENEKGEIFVDHIHCEQAAGKSRGYEIMAQAISEKIAVMWKLKKIN